MSIALLAVAIPLAAAQPAPPAPVTPAEGPPADPADPPPADPTTPTPDGPPTAPVPTDPSAVDPEVAASEALGDVDPQFGPMIVLEDIVVVGNRTTAERVILRALPLLQGEVLRAGDPRLKIARFKVLALGYFRDVTLALRKGSARGRVVLTVTVVERGTIGLNRLWFGSSGLAPWWLGADLTERNLLGTGLSIGGGLVFADHGGVTGARDQWGGELRLGAAGIAGTRWGGYGALTGQHGSEPYRVGGDPDESRLDDFRAFSYRRLAARVGARFDVRPTTGLTAELRVEGIDADVPVAPTRTLPDGRVVATDLGLRRGSSRVVSIGLGFDRDTRDDPVLAHAGSRVQARVELGSTLLGGSYDYSSLLGRYERWWAVRARHTVGLRIAGGVVLGSAPRFDRIHVADVNRLLTPRVMGMTVATAVPPDFLGTRNAEVVYGELGGNLIAEWAYRWFRRPRSIYGGDLFIAGGVWGLATDDQLRTRAGSAWDALPIDLVLDAGLRIDTELGVFEITIANALGRVPRW